MSTKHIFNSSDGLVLKSLRGAVALNPALRLHAASKTVYTANPSAPVAVISGGGAGHEPAHASYTGQGMLAASVSGDIFASPSAAQILTAIELATPSAPRAALLVVNNYTGDRLNFGLAAERARARGIAVAAVVVADDTALLDAPSRVGARGLAGNILVCKLLGAAAARGDDLPALVRLGDALVASLVSIGVGLEHCHVPGRTAAAGGLGEEECELGMGLHNEPGVRTVRLDGCAALVQEMLVQLLTSKARKARAEGGEGGEGTEFIRFGKDIADADAVVLFVNNLGGMSQLEMGAVLHEALAQLEATQIHPVRVYLSAYMTSLNAPGFSLSLLNLSAAARHLDAHPDTHPDPPPAAPPTVPALLQLLDAPTDALAWIGVRHWPTGTRDRAAEEAEADARVRALHTAPPPPPPPPPPRAHADADAWAAAGTSARSVTAALRAACAAVLAAAPDLARFDAAAGDGDCGDTFAAGAHALLRALDARELDVAQLDGARLVGAAAVLLEGSMGGTSGALFGLYFTALAAALRPAPPSAAPPPWPHAPAHALSALAQHTPARPGDRTLIDALSPFCAALSAGSGLAAAAAAARAGAERTRGMRARLGRATYVGAGGDPAGLPPDPGAWGVAAIVEALAGVLG